MILDHFSLDPTGTNMAIDLPGFAMVRVIFDIQPHFSRLQNRQQQEGKLIAGVIETGYILLFSGRLHVMINVLHNNFAWPV